MSRSQGEVVQLVSRKERKDFEEAGAGPKGCAQRIFDQ
jgi:hypothetical protein